MFGDPDPVLFRLECLIMLADWGRTPLILTMEHPVETKGLLPARLKRRVPEHARSFVKRSFNLCNEKRILDHLKQLGRGRAVVAGTETDVCILQSTIGLLENDFGVTLLTDCIFTSEPNPKPALRRMTHSGATPTSLTMLCKELQLDQDIDQLPKQLHSRRNEFQAYFHRPEDWPGVRPPAT
jgi:hypothetical protein